MDTFLLVVTLLSALGALLVTSWSIYLGLDRNSAEREPLTRSSDNIESNQVHAAAEVKLETKRVSLLREISDVEEIFGATLSTVLDATDWKQHVSQRADLFFVTGKWAALGSGVTEPRQQRGSHWQPMRYSTSYDLNALAETQQAVFGLEDRLRLVERLDIAPTDLSWSDVTEDDIRSEENTKEVRTRRFGALS